MVLVAVGDGGNELSGDLAVFGVDGDLIQDLVDVGVHLVFQEDGQEGHSSECALLKFAVDFKEFIVRFPSDFCGKFVSFVL